MVSTACEEQLPSVWPHIPTHCSGDRQLLGNGRKPLALVLRKRQLCRHTTRSG